MTLILSAVVPGFALQCSDRRLTRPDGTVFDDQTNKSVIWCNTLAVGFTGLAYINRAQDKPTSEWIAETLWRETDLRHGVDSLAAAAQAAMTGLPRHWDRRLAMHLSGFLPNGGPPINLTVSNFYGPAGPGPMTDAFSIVQHAPTQWSVIPIGAMLSPAQVRIVRAALPRLVRADAHPARVADFLTQLLRLVAHDQPTVGADALVTVIPQHPTDSGDFLLTDGGAAGSVTTATPSFDFRPADPTVRTRMGPHTVCGDYAMAGFTFEPSNESGSDGTLTVRMLKVPLQNEPAPNQ